MRYPRNAFLSWSPSYEYTDILLIDIRRVHTAYFSQACDWPWPHIHTWNRSLNVDSDLAPSLGQI